MKVTNKINIYLDAYEPTQEIRVMQCDANTRVLEFSLYENNTAWQAPSTAKLYVSYCKPDGTGGFYDTLPDGTGACIIGGGNTITAVLAEQVLTVPGKVQVAVSIQADDKILATFAVRLKVERNPGIGAMKSEDYFCLKAAIDAAVVAAQKPVALITVSQASDGSYQSDYSVTDIQSFIDHRLPVACYWYEKSVMAHLADFQTNGPFTFTAGSGAVEYSIVIKDNGVDCTATELAKTGDIPTKLSELENDSGYLTSAPVTSVNGQTGDVELPTPVWVTVTQNEDGTYKAEGWTTTKILEAHNAGNAVYCRHGNWVLPLLLATKVICSFGCVYAGNVHTVTIGAATVTVSTTPLSSGDGTGSGADGITPHIGENGNWFIGDTDTGMPSRGEDGEDGYTPQKGVDYFDGNDGQDGSPGKDGADGVSVTHEWNGTVLNVTSASGTSSADLKGEPGKDGSDGADGQPGADGADGYTPVKGKDYWTEADKAEMLEQLTADCSWLDGYSIPKLYLTGDTTGISKDNAVTLDWAYGENSGSCTLKWQGSSSIAYDKKNYTIKLDSKIDVGWGSQKKYCLKANYIDHSHARNIVSAKLWGQIVASRSPANPTLAACPNYGAVDGFPVAIVLNGEFHGLYTWNIPKDMWTFNMGDGTQEAIICANVDTPAVDLRVHAKVDGTDHELEEVTDEDNASWVAESLNNVIDLCVNSYGANLDTTIAQYMDWDSAIDYLILTVLIDGRDMYKKNYIMVTYDGSYWTWSAYDMDSTYGLQWAGKEIYPANDGISFVKFRVNRVMELIYRFKTDALRARYTELREGVLSEENLSVMFENFACSIPSRLLDEDAKKWASLPGTSVSNVDQILRWLHRRLAVVDKWVEALPAQETPVAPSAREGNVVPTSLDETGVVYNGTGYKNGYTIDISSDGIETEVAKEGCCITGFIPVTRNNIIHVTTDGWNISPTNSRIIFYNANFEPMAYYTQHGYVSLFNGYTNATAIKAKTAQSVTYGTDGMTTLNIAYGASCEELAYIRIRAVGNGANLVVIREGEVPDHATEPEPIGYTNQVPLSIDTDGSVFNGVGYQNGYRISTSSGSASADENSTISGFIPATNGDVIRVYGVDWVNVNGSRNVIAAYDSSFTYIGCIYGGSFKAAGTAIMASYEVLNDYDCALTLKTYADMGKTVAYVRVSSLGLGVATDGANMIVTVNEEIT